MGWAMSGVSEDERLDFASTSAVLRRTLRLVRPYRSQAVRAMAFLIAETCTLIAGPLLVRHGIDSGIAAGNSRQLNLAIVGYAVAAVASYLLFRWAIAALAYVGENFLRDLRTTVFGRLLQHSLPFYDRNQAGVLISRMTSDIDSLQDLVQIGLLMFTAAALLLGLSGLALLFLSWKLFALCSLTLPVVAVASRKFHRDSNRAYLAVRESIGSTLSSLQEGISGVRIVQAFGRESLEAERFAAQNAELYRTHMKSVRVAAWYLPIVDFAGAATTAVALGVGGWLVRDGQMSLGTVAAFILILQTMFGPVQQLSQLFNLVQSGTASLGKLFTLLDTPLDLKDPEQPTNLPANAPITIDDVTFRYGEDAPVLRAISLEIVAGERLALVGPTGAGKSTLAKLLARFYDPTSGTVRVGDVDLRDVSQESLRNHIVVVPQEGFLFAGSVADNIRLVRPEATDEHVAEALRRIGVWELFESLPDGLGTEVNERGSRLSAGEKQLVSLARAALADPSILILDEATSSIDPGTEAIVEAAMESLMRDRTVVVIAHRLSTSARCDRVGVIDDGRLTELGTHEELVAAGGHYAGLFDAWTQGLRSC